MMIDAHVHFNVPRDALLSYGMENDLRFLSIITDIPFFPTLQEQLETLLKLRKRYPGRLEFAASFSCRNWGSAGWLNESLDTLKRSLDLGAVGVKVWKNIGMSLKDESGTYIMIDHPSFEPIFSYLEENNIPLLGHIGEPRNCWLPLEEMTVASDRAYFSSHPEYHMYLHPELPSYEAQLEARDKMLKRHPALRFIGLHLASQEWDTDAVATFLDSFPNTWVDLAERISHLQHQAVRDPQKVSDFCLRYQDRIIYGSDIIDDPRLPQKDLIHLMQDTYTQHRAFFAEKEPMSAPEVTGAFRGLGLPPEVVGKLFCSNAEAAYRM